MQFSAPNRKLTYKKVAENRHSGESQQLFDPIFQNSVLQQAPIYFFSILRKVFLSLRKNIRPSQVSKPTCGELRHHYIVLSAGTVADQQFPVLSPAHHNAHMGIIRVEGQITGLGLRLRYGSAVGVLGAGASAPAQDILAAGEVVEDPIHKPGAVQAVGPVGPGCGASVRPHLGKLPPTAVPADHQGFSAPKIIHFSHQRECGLHRLFPGLVPVRRQSMEHIQHIGAGNGDENTTVGRKHVPLILIGGQGVVNVGKAPGLAVLAVDLPDPIPVDALDGDRLLNAPGYLKPGPFTPVCRG